MMSASDPLFLNADELAALTGFRLPARQSAWLQSRGWRFVLNGNRRPVVARRYAEGMLGVGVPQAVMPAQPNFAALRGA